MEDGICPLCERPLGERREGHHIVPKSKGGKDVVDVHPICHRKIHKVFTNAELAGLGTIEALQGHPEIAKFIKWIARKPPDFYNKTR